MSADTAARDRPGEGARLAADLEAAAERRPASRSLAPLAALRPFVAAHWGDAALSAVFLLISTSATLGLTWTARLLIDRGLASGEPGALDRWFLIAGAVIVVLAAATSLRFYFITKLGERVVADLRIALYRHITRLDQAFFLQVRTGEVLSRMTTDLTIVENMVGSSVSVALRNLLTLVGALALLVIVSPSFTGSVVVLGALVIVPLFLMGRRVRGLSARAQERFAGAVAYAGETLDALDTVQAFGRERRAAERLAAAVEGAFAASLARVRARALMTALVMVLIAGGIGVILWQASLAVFVRHAV